ncbi:MAG TPA: M24 family metallopeptidase [Steroidobacteraceae bacterium]|nr:M24 family metallopeptidase [Steroidobacteraceae bacterium]
MNAVTRPEEAVGSNYDRAGMLEARRQTFIAIERIADQIRPGMRESEGLEIARTTLKDMGMLRGWHGIYVRFGENTLCTYNEKNPPDRVLREDDLFYVDIGPVYQKWEGDGGDTFVLGGDPEMHQAKRDVREVFERVREKWISERISGRALYEYAESVAATLGWVLYTEVAGHRLADFPHKAFHSGPLAQVGFTPSADLWVLEIQIRHPTRPFGAFYEDLLLDR